ncbi:MAG: hypothetical protein K8F58_09355 [Bauldia sp.]|nr:hypothetical protein [Bauldia sp.]
MADATQEERWQRTAVLAGIAVAATLVGVLVLAVLSGATASEAGFPLAHILLTLALPVVPAAIVFWFADRQEAIDRQYGQYED